MTGRVAGRAEAVARHQVVEAEARAAKVRAHAIGTEQLGQATRAVSDAELRAVTKMRELFLADERNEDAARLRASEALLQLDRARRWRSGCELAVRALRPTA